MIGYTTIVKNMIQPWTAQHITFVPYWFKNCKNYFLHERVFHEPVVSGQSWRGSVPHLWPCEMIQKLFLTWTCLPWTCGLWTELQGFCSPPLALWNDTKIISYMNVSSMNLWSLDRAGGVLFPMWCGNVT